MNVLGLFTSWVLVDWALRLCNKNFIIAEVTNVKFWTFGDFWNHNVIDVLLFLQEYGWQQFWNSVFNSLPKSKQTWNIPKKQREKKIACFYKSLTFSISHQATLEDKGTNVMI